MFMAIQLTLRKLEKTKGPYVTINENVGSFEILDILVPAIPAALYAGGAPGRNSSEHRPNSLAMSFDVFKIKNITYIL